MCLVYVRIYFSHRPCSFLPNSCFHTLLSYFKCWNQHNGQSLDVDIFVMRDRSVTRCRLGRCAGGLWRAWNSTFHSSEDHDMNHLEITPFGYDALCMTCTITDATLETRARSFWAYTTPTGQHEVGHTDHTDHTEQESIRPDMSRSPRRNRWSARSVQWLVW